MDPPAALGLASSIFAFAHFASGVLGGARKVLRTCRHKSSGIHINRVYGDLRELAAALDARRAAMCAPERHQDLMHLAASCHVLYRDLAAMLDRMQASDGTSWDKIRATIKGARRRGGSADGMVQGMADMRTRLDKCHSEIALIIAQILQRNLMALQVVLHGLGPTKPSPPIKMATELRRLKHQLVDATTKRDFIFGQPRVEFQAHAVQAVNAVDGLLATLASPPPTILVLKQLNPRLPRNAENAAGSPPDRLFSWIANTAAGAAGDSDLAEHVVEVKETSEDGTMIPSENEHSDSGLDLTALDKPLSDAKARAHSRWRLVSWLQAGDGIFHVSGRAGSGKSALVSFLAHDTDSATRLANWAGERQLLIAHFPLPSGHPSRNDLYRALLFEVVRSIPALAKEVFPEAYVALENKYPSSLVQGHFFNDQAVERAFDTLMSMDMGDDYRICLFIDGLDGYDTKRWKRGCHEHEVLAENLWRWVGSRNVKLLVSSRPSRAISSIFLQEERRMRLEAVTDPDIATWCRRRVLEKEVGSCSKDLSMYQGLVSAIVRRAEGNFLWAQLATNFLMSLDVKGPARPSALEARFEFLPRDIGDMYSAMFDAIEEADRAKVFKMLLLVGSHPKRSVAGGGVDAIQLSWVGELDDPDFPINRPRVPYSPAEIELRQLRVRQQIETSAKAFLVVMETTDSGPLVRFSHRTVAEWVDRNEQMQKLRTRVASPDTYTRIALAEMWFESSAAALIGRAGWWLPVPSLDEPGYVCRKEILDAFISVHAEFGAPFTLYGRSFLHRLAHSHSVGHYLRWKAAQYELINEDGAPELSLLATSLIGCQVENVATLLELGMSPRRSLRIRSHVQPKQHIDVSIWVVYLWRFAEMIIYGTFGPGFRATRTSDVSATSTTHLQASMDYWLMLVMLLESGCDPECVFLLSERADNTPTHAISLRRLISNSQKPDGVKIPMEILRGSHHPGVTGCKPYGLYKQERMPGLGDGSYDVDTAKFKLVSVKCGSEELTWSFSKVHVY